MNGDIEENIDRPDGPVSNEDDTKKPGTKRSFRERSRKLLKGGKKKGITEADIDRLDGPVSNDERVLQCQEALGMESGAISDAQISASSERDGNFAARQARLHIQAKGGKKGSWSAHRDDQDQWLQVDLGKDTDVTCIATQGRHACNEWVTKYKLQYSSDEVSFHYYQDKEFDGNNDRYDIVKNQLSPPIRARYIRVCPVAWHKHISMRIELYSCKAEKILRAIIETEKKGRPYFIDELKRHVTAENLCSCKDPIMTAFELNFKLREFAGTYTENTKFLNTLADQVEDFAIKLMDQVTSKEQLVMHDHQADRYASLLSCMTDNAIVYEQKKFVSHPLLYERLKQRWNLGLPESLQPRGRYRSLLLLITMLDFALTPLLLPFIPYAFYRNQNKAENNSKRTFLDKYWSYFTSSVVLFIKDKLSQLVFIALHVRICTLGSSVTPQTEEYLIFIFACGLVLSEHQQYKTSPKRGYFKDMWNYVDIMTLLVYICIVILRVSTIALGGVPHENRLLEIVNFLYGFNTMFLILRFSSVLELNSTVGPLQLALMRMLIDLLIVLLQFVFVILAFSVAITKGYIAEMSYVTSSNLSDVDSVQYQGYCSQGTFQCLFKTCTQLIWSVFGLTDLEDMDSHTSLTSNIVSILYLMFLVLSVIMLVNMLVALLTTTYDDVTSNADVEWKFSRAVVENGYRRLHAIVVPFNLISIPIKELCFAIQGGDIRRKEAEKREEDYRQFYVDYLFPEITKRYQDKYEGSFPLSGDEKLDLIMKNLNMLIKESASRKEAKDPADGSVTLDKSLTASISQIVSNV